MEALKRIGCSLFFLFLSVLASMGFVWLFFTETRPILDAYHFWGKVMLFWMGIGWIACLTAAIVLCFGSIASLFIPAEKTLKAFK